MAADDAEIGEDWDNDVLDERELHEIDRLTARYEKLIKPGILARAGQKVGDIIPASVKKVAGNAKNAVMEQQLYQQAMDVVASGFKVVEEQAAKMTVSESTVLKKIDSIVPDRDIASLDEVCFARSYEVAKVVNGERTKNLGIAMVEGAVTGAPGFAGIPFNLVLSTFCYYRAVQSVAMFYGYDVKNDNEELVIASEVFSSAMSPGDVNGELGNTIGKIMMLAEANVVKDTVKKGWTAMAQRHGIPLLIVQLRALANKAAKRALEKAGEAGLENAMFRGVFEQIGKRLTQQAVKKAVPVVSAAIGAFFDTAQMNKVLDYADVFYQKRFILEKGMRQNFVCEADGSIE